MFSLWEQQAVVEMSHHHKDSVQTYSVWLLYCLLLVNQGRQTDIFKVFIAY